METLWSLSKKKSNIMYKKPGTMHIASPLDSWSLPIAILLWNHNKDMNIKYSMWLPKRMHFHCLVVPLWSKDPELWKKDDVSRTHEKDQKGNSQMSLWDTKSFWCGHQVRLCKWRWYEVQISCYKGKKSCKRNILLLNKMHDNMRCS